ncbi:hypothetical protein SMICM304S_02999 [Streptomyces microflavus]
MLRISVTQAVPKYRSGGTGETRNLGDGDTEHQGDNRADGGDRHGSYEAVAELWEIVEQYVHEVSASAVSGIRAGEGAPRAPAPCP